MFGGSIPLVISQIIQDGFLAREMEEGLDSVLGFRKIAIVETFPANIGETLTRTRKGRQIPLENPVDTTANSLDNGLTPQAAFTVEQYSFTLQEYAATVDLNLMADDAAIASSFIANARNLAVQAAQTQERLCRNALYSAYLGGNTRAITEPSNTIISNTPGANPASIANAASDDVHVDDIRGFQTLLVNGVRTPVSGSNPLSIEYNGTSGGVTVTAATPYAYQSGKSALNVTNTPRAIPGFLTIANNSGGALTITGAGASDAIIALNAPRIVRLAANGTDVADTRDLVVADKVRFEHFQKAVAYLRDNGVPPQEDGTYHVFLDNESMTQLFTDTQFQNVYRGAHSSSEWKNMDIVIALGMTFIPTTETYVQPSTGTAVFKPQTRIRRAIVCGAECIIQGNFEGMETWLADRGSDLAAGSDMAMIDGVVQIIRAPLDRLKRLVSQSWFWLGDFAVPSDVTANSSIIPTGGTRLGNPEFKRCVVIEFAG